MSSTAGTTDRYADRIAPVGQALLVVTVLLACLLPFGGKAFHIDDPLFVWAARQIAQQPLDFYGFDVNWYGSPDPMWSVMKNPPAASYYLALVGSVLGWSETTLHLALLLPAAALAWGIHALARRYAAPAGIAGLTAVLTPALLVSATTVMCDVLMMALWVWALVFWDRGLRRGTALDLLTGASLAGACALAKYFGLSLIPLMACAALVERKRVGRSLAFLLVPVAVLLGYQVATTALYERGLLFDAAEYATLTRDGGFGATLARLAQGLSFTGGGAASLLCLSPLLLTRRTAGAAAALAVVLIPVLGSDAVARALYANDALRMLVVPQLTLWIVVGAGAVALAVDEARRQRDAASLVLLSWVAGTFVFAAFVNWTVNVRSVLPMVPALGILAARRIERLRDARPRWLLPAGLVAAAGLALAVAWVDRGLADAARHAARAIVSAHTGKPGVLWFQGHWGFQYYAQRLGARPLETTLPRVGSGDIVAVPVNNTNAVAVPEEVADLVGTLDVPVSPWGATMSYRLGAGFYSSGWGPLPFAFGPATPETYLVYRIRPPG